MIQRKFEAIDCVGRDRVPLAAHQLTGTALVWWENYCAAADDVTTITWEEFTEEFRRYHIPEATMRLKADEFRSLTQGNKSVEDYTYHFNELSRYAPEEVNTDAKKQNLFKKGLIPELRTLMTPQIYPDFNTLMNMAILTERSKAEEKKENKRKFMEHKANQQGRFQRPRNSNFSVQKTQAPIQYKSQAPMQYRTQASASYQPNNSYKSQSIVKTQQNSTGQVTSNTRACFNCRETGHFIANCPYANKPATSTFSNTVNGPRPAMSGANRVPLCSSNNNNSSVNNNQQIRQP